MIVSKILLIGLGGFIGSALRYVVSGAVQQATGSVAISYGTLVVNVAGCLLIGFLSQIAESHGGFGPETRAFVFIGLLGGFTTFSTFAHEAVNSARDGEAVIAGAYVLAHVVLGLAAVWLGRAGAHLLWR
jgi:CrcB protein